MSALSSDSASRRYLALVARAKDQTGTPEGDTCRRMAESMLAARPDLADLTGPLPTEWREYRYKDGFERDLLIRIGLYLDLSPKSWTRNRKRVVLFEADVPTHAAIEQTFEVLRERMHAALTYAFTGFEVGALPLPPKPGEPESASPKLDAGLLELAMAARSFGADSRPRKALGSSE